MNDNLAHARAYLAALEGDVSRDELARFFTADVVQEEFPNRLVPSGATRDLEGILEGHERGRQLMASQRYEITNAITTGNQVALEVRWSGTLAQKSDSLPAVMRARFAVFLQFRDGKIEAQRNYDCFDPW